MKRMFLSIALGCWAAFLATVICNRLFGSAPDQADVIILKALLALGLVFFYSWAFHPREVTE